MLAETGRYEGQIVWLKVSATNDEERAYLEELVKKVKSDTMKFDKAEPDCTCGNGKEKWLGAHDANCEWAKWRMEQWARPTELIQKKDT